MSREEKFIQDCTRNCSNELCAVEDRFGKKVISYNEWLTPDQARRAVEIAREEMIEKAYAAFCKVCKLNCNHRECYYLNNFKQAIKDE